jgi:hypothetical protein
MKMSRSEIDDLCLKNMGKLEERLLGEISSSKRTLARIEREDASGLSSYDVVTDERNDGIKKHFEIKDTCQRAIDNYDDRNGSDDEERSLHELMKRLVEDERCYAIDLVTRTDRAARCPRDEFVNLVSSMLKHNEELLETLEWVKKRHENQG